MIYFGVNTGTSADAVDCVACEFRDNRQKFLDALTITMPIHMHNEIMHAVEVTSLDLGRMKKLSAMLTKVYISAIQALMHKMAITKKHVAAIGVHGQTIHHKPFGDYPYTVQLGNGATIANHIGVDVVDHFRDSDISVGGQGAPLIPAYHRFLAHSADQRDAIFINLGGIANITICHRHGGLSGWDIGPANALMDLWCQKCQQLPYDRAGQWARSGTIIQPLLEIWLKDPYFSAQQPKSTGRDYFSTNWLQQSCENIDQYAPEDVQATLCELTAVTIMQDIKKCASEQNDVIYLYGKGIANEFLVERLKLILPSFRIESTASIGIAPDWLEGGLFAWLAFQYKSKRATDLSQVTGAQGSAVLGSCYLASA